MKVYIVAQWFAYEGDYIDSSETKVFTNEKAATDFASAKPESRLSGWRVTEVEFIQDNTRRR